MDRSRRFQKEIRNRLDSVIKMLKRFGYLKENGELTEFAINKVLNKRKIIQKEEVVGKVGKGYRTSNKLGQEDEYFTKKFSISDKYYEIDRKKSVRSFLTRKTWYVTKKKDKRQGNFIILLDVSGSMFGEKILYAKQALAELLREAIKNRDKVSIILFNDKILQKYINVKNIEDVISSILKISPIGSTDIALAIKEALNYAKNGDRILLITDALPTFGESPIQDTIRSIEMARNKGVIVSVIGIKLNDEGKRNAEKIVQISKGNLYIVDEPKDLPRTVLEEYKLFLPSKGLF